MNQQLLRGTTIALLVIVLLSVSVWSAVRMFGEQLDKTETWGAANSTTASLRQRHDKDSILFAQTYPSVSEDNSFIYATFEEVENLLETGSGILVVGFPACPRCHNAFPVLDRAFKETNSDRHEGLRGKILFYDIFDDRDASNERYQYLVEKTKDFLQADDSGNPRIFVPDIFFISSGKIVGNHLDTVKSVSDPWASLTEAQEAELLGIYKELIRLMDEADDG